MTKRRCDWCNGNHLYENYHDIVWGVPVFEDNILFESLTLEIFQSGLSWITILKKREGFIKAFDSFDIYKIASYDIKKEKEHKNINELAKSRDKRGKWGLNL